MPKRALYALGWNLQSREYEIKQGKVRIEPSPLRDADTWKRWLEGSTSFAFEGQAGIHATIRKEQMQRGGDYWYAYCTQQGKTRKRYLGKSEDVTLARLEKVVGGFEGELSPHQQQTVPKETMTQTHLPLLVTKFQPPHLSPRLIERRRLFTQLDEALVCPLTLLSAPTGYGKTTLARQWLESHQKQQEFPLVAWIALDAEDNDPIRFWRYVITACQTLMPEVGQAALVQLTTPLQPPFAQPTLETELVSFLNDLTTHTQRGLLILDDFHLLTTPLIHKTLTFFLEHLPDTLRIILLSRSEPPLPLVRLRAKGNLCEIAFAELRFTEDEVGTFLRQTLSSSFTDDMMKHITARLEGWPTGLRLLSLALRGKQASRELEQALTTLSGNQYTFWEYFVSEVLETQSPALQEFLLQTSVLSRLNGDLCSVLMNRQDGPELLASAFQAGLFLERLEGPEGVTPWYRYHTLFAEAMRTQVQRRLGIEATHQLFLRASLWYEEHGMKGEAVEAAFQAQESERGAELITSILATVPHFGGLQEMYTLHRWLKQVPDTILRNYPVLCLHYASVLAFGASDQPIPHERLEALLQMAEEGWRDQEQSDNLGQVFAFRALLAARQGQRERTSILARRALALLPAHEAGWRAVCLGAVGSETLRAGQVHEAQQILAEAHSLWERVGNYNAARGTLSLLGATYMGQGALRLAGEHFQRVIREAREQHDLFDLGHALLRRGQLSYEWNALAEAQEVAHEALAPGKQYANEGVHVGATLLLARVAHATGQREQAQQQITSLLPDLTGNAALYAEAVFNQAQLLFLSGDHEAAEHCLRSIVTQNVEPDPLLREQRDILRARELLARDEAEQAITLLQSLLGEAQRAGRMQRALEIQVLLALAHASCKHSQKARNVLRSVLAHACAEGYQRLFLDEGEAMRMLLQAMLPSIHEPAQVAYIRELLLLFANGGERATSALTEPLSSQEQRVLRLLIAGHSNPEIARELVVSVNTVKAQLKSVYRKLNVNNRVEASAVARQLHLV